MLALTGEDRALASRLEYDKQGNIVREVRVLELDGLTLRDLRFSYDYLGRLTAAVTAETLGADPLEDYAYAYDANGNLLHQTSTFAGARAAENEVLAYEIKDGSNLLTSVTRSAATGPTGTFAMSYDANGNLASDGLPKLLDGGGVGPVVTNIVSNHQNLPRRIELNLPDSDHVGVIEYRYDSEGRQISRWSWEEDSLTAEIIAGSQSNEWNFHDAQGRLDARVGLDAGTLDQRWVNLLMQVLDPGAGEQTSRYRVEFMDSLDTDDPPLPGSLVRNWNTYGARGLLAQTRLPVTGMAALERDVLYGEVMLNDHLGSSRLKLEVSRLAIYNDRDNESQLIDLVVDGWTARNPMDYTPYGRELPQPGDEKSTLEGYTGKPLESTFGLQAMNYGARFYDARLGRWWQGDPLAEDYSSISPYTAMENTPLLLVDPDGRLTQVSQDGTVASVFDDGSLDINMRVTGQNSSYLIKVGETKYYDEFLDGENPSGRIRLGEDWGSALSVGLDLGSKLNYFGLAVLSGHNGVLDLKRRSDIAPDGPYTGRLLNGRYISARSLGNYVFGKNCANSGATWEETIYPAGAYQQTRSLYQAGKHYMNGQPYPGTVSPYWGEETYSGRWIEAGYMSGSEW